MQKTRRGGRGQALEAEAQAAQEAQAASGREASAWQGMRDRAVHVQRQEALLWQAARVAMSAAASCLAAFDHALSVAESGAKRYNPVPQQVRGSRMPENDEGPWSPSVPGAKKVLL